MRPGISKAAAVAAIIAWTRSKQAARAAKAVGSELDDLLRADEQLFRLGLELIAKAGKAGGRGRKKEVGRG